MQISQIIVAFLATTTVTTLAAASTIRAVDFTPRKASGMFMQQGSQNGFKIQDALMNPPEAPPQWTVKALPAKVSKIPHMVQMLLAFAWIFMLGGVPFILPMTDDRPVTKTQISLAAVTVLVLFGGFYLFTNVILFQSSHFAEQRPLTVVECIYFMAQVITTVGYGDIGPAKTRGQIFVGLYVLFSLFVIAMVVEDFTEHVVRAASEYKKKWRRQETEEIVLSAREHHDVNISALICPQKPSLQGLWNALAVFAFFDITFIMFFSMYPGEEKTMFEATYMSLITLGTVGFGFFTPITEAGMVFNAFWMVAGCGALVCVIGEFTLLMYQLNEYERYNKPESKMGAMESLKEITHGSDKVTALDFLQFCLVESKKVDKDELDNILKVFESLSPKNGSVDMMAIQRATTPRQVIVE